MSREEGSVPVPGGGSLSKQPNFRREWDKEAFEAKAKARLAEEESLEEERERKKTAPAPIVQRAPLQRRTEELRLDKFEGFTTANADNVRHLSWSSALAPPGTAVRRA